MFQTEKIDEWQKKGFLNFDGDYYDVKGKVVFDENNQQETQIKPELNCECNKMTPRLLSSIYRSLKKLESRLDEIEKRGILIMKLEQK